MGPNSSPEERFTRRRAAMFTVITETTLKPGQEEDWDRAFQERITEASRQPGWLGVNLLIPTEDMNKRVVVGTWRSQGDWDRWHATDAFKQARPKLAAATKDDGQPRWYNVDTAKGQAAQA
jgi:heme-degrading monooxygenase HmoA